MCPELLNRLYWYKEEVGTMTAAKSRWKTKGRNTPREPKRKGELRNQCRFKYDGTWKRIPKPSVSRARATFTGICNCLGKREEPRDTKLCLLNFVSLDTFLA